MKNMAERRSTKRELERRSIERGLSMVDSGEGGLLAESAILNEKGVCVGANARCPSLFLSLSLSKEKKKNKTDAIGSDRKGLLKFLAQKPLFLNNKTLMS